MKFIEFVDSYIDRINDALDKHSTEMFPDLPYGVRVGITVGKKYIRVVKFDYDRETGEVKENSRSVYGFIVAVDNDKKFELGDVLKANSWKAPARNFVRGSVFTINDDSNINPYGV